MLGCHRVARVVLGCRERVAVAVEVTVVVATAQHLCLVAFVLPRMSLGASNVGLHSYTYIYAVFGVPEERLRENGRASNVPGH